MIIGVISQKGGVGKSTLARLIAREYAQAGWHVKIADLDIQQSTAVNWQARRLQNALEPVVAVERFGTVAQAMQAAGLIGSGVLVPGNRVLVGEDGSTTPFGVELEQAADEVQITVRNDSGEVVRRFEPFAMDAGSESFTWNGEMDSGENAPKGSYTVSVEASADGEPLEVVNLNYAMVSGVSLDDNGAPLLDLGGVSEQVSLGDIRQIL